MAREIVDLGFRPRDWQLTMLRSLRRFSVVVVHRRGGKTVAAILKLIDAALRCELPRPRYAYIAPELKQAKGVAWDYLRSYAGRIPGTRINESELWVEFPNGARIRLYGADNPDSLRGLYFDGVVLDEVAQMRPFVWGEILTPTLADRTGWALFIGTPKGTNLFSELYHRRQGDPEWYVESFPIAVTNALDAAELQHMRANMTDQQWRQEMNCDFAASDDDVLISIDLVDTALGRHLQGPEYEHAAKVLGVDVALQGGDRTVIQPRQGLAAFEPTVMNQARPYEIADAVARMWAGGKADGCFVDDSGGYGSGVIDRLMQLGFTPTPVQFGGRANDARFANKGGEMWWGIREWLISGGALPPMQEYRIDLTGRRYDYANARGLFAVESKEHMAKRGLRSPDFGDALALTFAYFVAPQPRTLADSVGLSPLSLGGTGRAITDWDPYDESRMR